MARGYIILSPTVATLANAKKSWKKHPELFLDALERGSLWQIGHVYREMLRG